MKSVFPAALFVAACAVGLCAACGSLTGHTGSPTVLATVQGALTLSADAPPISDNIHIAVIWKTVGAGGPYEVAVDLPVQPVFPSRYVLQLTEPPPASAMIPNNQGDPELSVAEGVLVAYEDLNGNG